MIIKSQPRTEAKCNFCFAWIYSSNLDRKLLNICNDCLQKGLSQEFLCRSMQTDEYQLMFFHKYTKEEVDRCENRATLLECADQMLAIELKEVNDKWNEVRKGLYEHENIGKDRKEAIQAYLHTAVEQNVNFHNEQNLKLNILSDQTFGTGYLQCAGRANQKNILSQSDCVSRLTLPNNEQSMKRSALSALSLNGNFSKDKTSQSKDKTTSSKDKTNSTASKTASKYSFHYDTETILAFQDKQNDLELNLLNLLMKQGKAKSSRSRCQQDEMIVQKEQAPVKDDSKNRIIGLLEEKYSSKAFTRLMANSIKQAFDKTKFTQNALELISVSIGDIDLEVYLKLFDFTHLKRIKLVNAGLKNSQLKVLLDFIANRQVQALVLPCNKLTEQGLHHLAAFESAALQQVYLGKNRIYKYRVRPIISSLRKRLRLFL